MNKKFYVTTPIYYATAKPHLGTLYSTVLADISARWNAMQGKDVFLLVGTDEFGQKVAQAAEKAGKKPYDFVSLCIDDYKSLWKKYDISYNWFIRTTDEYHVKAVQSWITMLMKKGDIYKGLYEGWYCLPCETYITEKDFQKDKKIPLCPSCERETSSMSEPCYFFKLSAYQDKLLQFYAQNSDFITPKERMAEVLSFVKGGLQDLSISRTATNWGIPFPGDEKCVTYVWADALNNYITAIGYAQKGRENEFEKWWPADLQVLGKDIVRFHAVYWPAFLMAAGLPLPKKQLVHGWIKVGEHKMSKSRGNSVDPEILYKEYGADEIRYYLARQLAITQDGQFSIDDLEQKISTDLANDLGNLVYRVTTLIEQHEMKTVHVQPWQEQERALQNLLWEEVSVIERYMNDGYYHMALSHLWKYIAAVNAYVHNNEPWKLVKTDRAGFERIMSAACHSLYAIAHLLWPVMPKKMEQLLDILKTPRTLQINYLSEIKKNIWNMEFVVKKGEPLFKKFEVKPMTEQIKEISPEYISIDDFSKVTLRAGTIIACEDVNGSEKLWRLKVRFSADEERIIFSGIKKIVPAQDLQGKQAIFVTNLKPRKMMGEESQGMLLSAKDTEGTLRPVLVANPVPDGSVLV